MAGENLGLLLIAEQLELPGFEGTRGPHRRVADGQGMLAPVGDEELEQKDLSSGGVPLNFGGMPEWKVRNWRQ